MSNLYIYVFDLQYQFYRNIILSLKDIHNQLIIKYLINNHIIYNTIWTYMV